MNKKGKLVKFMSMTLAVAVVLGSVVYSQRSKADEAQSEIKVEKMEPSDVKNSDEFLEYLKELGKEVTITNIDDLYDLLESKKNISDDEVEELLASSSEEVVKEYVAKEIINAQKILQQLGEEKENIVVEDEDSDYVKDIDVKELKSGNNYKTIKTVENKYGTSVISEIKDFEEDTFVTRENWSALTKWHENCTKKYGKRMYSYSDLAKIGKVKIFGGTMSFHYTVSDKGLTSRGINAEATSIFASVMSCDVIEKKVTDSSASGIGENIDGHVIYKCVGEWLGLAKAGQLKFKYNMVVTIKKWDKKGKSMVVEHYVAPYMDAAL